MSKNGLNLVCNVNIVYGDRKSENFQDYAQKPQRNCTFMNSASVIYPSQREGISLRELEAKESASRQFSSLLFTVTYTNGFYPPPTPSLSKSGLKLVCNVNIVYGDRKSENSQDYAQKPQRNCTFTNSASVIYPSQREGRRGMVG